jgi:hypothetical protein
LCAELPNSKERRKEAKEELTQRREGAKMLNHKGHKVHEEREWNIDWGIYPSLFLCALRALCGLSQFPLRLRAFA